MCTQPQANPDIFFILVYLSLSVCIEKVTEHTLEHDC